MKNKYGKEQRRTNILFKKRENSIKNLFTARNICLSFFTSAFYCYSTSFYLISNFQFSIFGSLLFISDQIVTPGLIHCLSSVGRSWFFRDELFFFFFFLNRLRNKQFRKFRNGFQISLRTRIHALGISDQCIKIGTFWEWIWIQILGGGGRELV